MSFTDPNAVFNALFPRKWWAENIPPAYVWVYVNWLHQELDVMAEERWPILKQIRGHRRMEVIEYLSHIDWTVGVLDTKMFKEGWLS